MLVLNTAVCVFVFVFLCFCFFVQLVHGRVVDTSVLYPHPATPWKHSLKYLAHSLLSESIQSGSHDSVEDARTAMRLAQLKFTQGPDFALGPPLPEENLTETFDRRDLKSVIIDTPGSCKRFAAAHTDCDGVELDQTVRQN